MEGQTEKKTTDRHKNKNSIVRIGPETYDTLKEISEKTRFTIGKIATEAIEYALRHARLVPSDVMDIEFVDDIKEKERIRKSKA